jgi:hypothetical protein
MVGRRVLVQEGRHVHLLGAMEALDAIERLDLRAQPAHHEVLEDPRRRPHLRRRHRRSPSSQVAGILGTAGCCTARILSTVSALCAQEGEERSGGGGGGGGGRGGCGRKATRPCGLGGRLVFDPLRILEATFFSSLLHYCLCLTMPAEPAASRF